MKFLLSPIGLIVIVIVLLVVFFPRRAPDAVKKTFGRPMRAFPDEKHSPPAEPDAASKVDAQGGSAGDTAQGGKASGPSDCV